MGNSHKSSRPGRLRRKALHQTLHQKNTMAPLKKTVIEKTTVTKRKRNTEKTFSLAACQGRNMKTKRTRKAATVALGRIVRDRREKVLKPKSFRMNKRNGKQNACRIKKGSRTNKGSILKKGSIMNKGSRMNKRSGMNKVKVLKQKSLRMNKGNRMSKMKDVKKYGAANDTKKYERNSAGKLKRNLKCTKHLRCSRFRKCQEFDDIDDIDVREMEGSTIYFHDTDEFEDSDSEGLLESFSTEADGTEADEEYKSDEEYEEYENEVDCEIENGVNCKVENDITEGQEDAKKINDAKEENEEQSKCDVDESFKELEQGEQIIFDQAGSNISAERILPVSCVNQNEGAMKAHFGGFVFDYMEDAKVFRKGMNNVRRSMINWDYLSVNDEEPFMENKSILELTNASMTSAVPVPQIEDENAWENTDEKSLLIQCIFSRPEVFRKVFEEVEKENQEVSRNDAAPEEEHPLMQPEALEQEALEQTMVELEALMEPEALEQALIETEAFEQALMEPEV